MWVNYIATIDDALVQILMHVGIRIVEKRPQCIRILVILGICRFLIKLQSQRGNYGVNV